MKEVFIELKKYKKESILGPLFKLLEAIAELFVPLVIASIIDGGIASSDRAAILRSCALLAGLAAFGLLCSVTAQYFAAKAATGCAAGLRRRLFEKLLSLDFSEADRLGASTMITRMTGDITQVQTGVNLTLRLLLRSPFVVFGAVLMAFTVDAKTALIFVGVLLPLSALVFGIMLRCLPLYKRVQAALDELTVSVRENLSGVRVIRAFCKEQSETDLFDDKNRRLTAIQSFTGRIAAVMNPGAFLLVNAAAVLLLYTGAIRVDTGVLKTGEVVALYNYMAQILTELIKLADLIINITRSAACAERVRAVLTLPEPPDGTVELLPENEPAVEFLGVTFRYENASSPCLTNIDFRAQRGESIGIIGSTGSGKTSLVSLIPRFYRVSEGQVLVNGVNVNDIKRETLTKKVAVVPQKASLFSGTIRENLCFGRDADDEEILQAVRAAQAEDILLAKKDGLDEKVEQGGRNFSGGQKQRLTVARALIQNADILILDDSTSALDPSTAAAMTKAIASLPTKPTVFTVSQRASSVLHCDQILVLDAGRCVGLGTHEQLLSSCPVYREIYEAQFAGREAAQ